MLKTAKLILVISFSCLLSACGFELPSQEDLSKAVPKLNVEGDYHSSFYKYVVQKLRMAGVEVNSQNSDYYQNDSEVPTLMIPTSHVETKVVAVDSMAQSLEENMLISVAATLSIKGHKPILIKNSLTRSILNKSGFALASQTEKDTVIDETFLEMRIRAAWQYRKEHGCPVPPSLQKVIRQLTDRFGLDYSWEFWKRRAASSRKAENEGSQGTKA